MNDDARHKLFGNAPALAAQIRYEDLSISRLCELAQVPAHEFRAAFGDVSSYIEALQQEFLAEIRGRIIKVTDGTPSGLARVRMACESYLAYCLENAHVRDWLVAARELPNIQRGLLQQNHSFALVLGAEFNALGRRDPIAAARLFITMLNEIATGEQRIRQADPALRDALWHFMEHVGIEAASAQQRPSAASRP